MAEFRIPSSNERIAVIGRTGSGKTQAAVWQLSLRDFDTKPWIIFNSKGDKLIDDIPGTVEMDIKGDIPKKPGIYIIRPLPDEKEETDNFLYKCWKKENVGIYIDEGYNLTGLKFFRACLTQGRSKNIPMIVLAQRPSWIDRFVWSESDFFQAFSVNLKDDAQVLASMVPGYDRVRLPPFWSFWHDVKAGASFKLRPVPDADTLLETFRRRVPGLNRIKLIA